MNFSKIKLGIIACLGIGFLLTGCSKTSTTEGSDIIKKSDPVIAEIEEILENWGSYEDAVAFFLVHGTLQTSFVDGGAGPQSAIVCEGSGYSFAKCVKDWLEDNPERCLKVSMSSGGNFEADDDCEP